MLTFGHCQRLTKELEEAHKASEHVAHEANSKLRELRAESSRNQEAAEKALAGANKRARQQAEEQLRRKIEDECRVRMRAEMEESLRQERVRGEQTAEVCLCAQRRGIRTLNIPRTPMHTCARRAGRANA